MGLQWIRKKAPQWALEILSFADVCADSGRFPFGSLSEYASTPKLDWGTIWAQAQFWGPGRSNLGLEAVLMSLDPEAKVPRVSQLGKHMPASPSLAINTVSRLGLSAGQQRVQVRD